MTRTDFQSEANMAELASLLRSPVLRAALDIIKAEAVTALPEPVPGVAYQDQVAAAGAHAIGWARAIRALEGLAIRPGGVRLPFEVQYDEPARRKMREAGVYSEEQISSIKP